MHKAITPHVHRESAQVAMQNLTELLMDGNDVGVFKARIRDFHRRGI
jgi:hypothetical protein